ncbi:glutamine-hydrolyzing GMP synthase [bacterium CG_4_9_14_3_um_filter_65_15]|nr:MAG: glutamine-hydrolyzing GMP synthase [bacterium CG_4_9_14_3_um_filter_65_15]
MQHDKIAVVDFGGQYAHLIATKVRRSRVLAEIRQPEDLIEEFASCKGVILSGSPALASFGEDSGWNKAILDLDVPILGFCFGHQEIAKHYGGTVINGKQEWGHADLHLLREHPLFAGLDKVEQVWMSHFDSVTGVGPDFEELGYSVLDEAAPPHRFAAIGSDKLRRYGFQFHPEVDDTVHGDDMIANFVLGICGCSPTWTMDNYVQEQIERIRAQVGDGSVFLLASGGVDSTVAARLFAEALGPQRLQLLHVDNGLMRKDESAQVVTLFSDLGLGENLHFIDAGETFLQALEGKIEPEAKRRAIGDTFITVFESEARRLGITDHLLGQGTIYPDTIETGGTKRADTIKTHHNRVPVIEEMIAAGRVIEPLADLYKVEVRELGEMLDIPHAMIRRHPFPGPGLGVRLLCSDGTVPDQDGLDKIGPAVAELAAAAGLEAMPLPIRSVGVKADLRSYEHPVLLHGDADFATLTRTAGRIFKSVAGLNRALWNLAPEPPRVLRPLAATMSRQRLDLLRECDHLVMEGLRRHGLYDRIWQCPTVLVPLEVDGRGRELCIIRPVLSERAMTATAAELPRPLLDDLRQEILTLPGISGLAYDLTSKPPGTIEWE